MATAIQSSQHSTGSKSDSKAALIIRQAKMLFSAYRRDEFADPEGFVMQLGAVLSAYPESVILHATGPMTGLQRRCKFPPSIAEVVTECDSELARLERIARYQAMGPVQKQLPPPPGDRCNFDEMVAKHGRPLGPYERGTVFENYAGRQVVMGRKAGDFKKFTVEDLQRLYARNDEAAA